MSRIDTPLPRRREIIPPPPKLQADALSPSFSELVRQHLCRLAAHNKRKNLFALMLPPFDPDDTGSVFETPHRLCEELADNAGDSMWLALWIDGQHRPQWRGIAATEMSADAFKITCFDVTGGRVKIKVIADSEEGWSLSVANHPYRHLSELIRGALQPQSQAGILGHYRVVAAGFLKLAWMRATGLIVADRKTLFVQVTRNRRAGDIACQEMASSASVEPRRRCRNYNECRGFIPLNSLTGRRTRIDCTRCADCAAIEKEKREILHHWSPFTIRKEGSRYP